MTKDEKNKIKLIHNFLTNEVCRGNSYKYDMIISRTFMEFVSQLKLHGLEK